MIKKIVFLLFVLCSNLQDISAKASDIDSLKNILTNTNVDTVKINTYLKLAEILRKSDPEKARKYITLSLQESKNQPNKIFFVKSNNRDAVIDLQQGKLDEAEVKLRKSLEIINDKHLGGNLKGTTIMNLGLVSFYRSDFEKFKSYLLKSQLLFQESKDTLNLIKVYNNLGALDMGLGNFNNTIDYFIIGLKLSNAIHFTEMQAQISGNLATIYAQTGQNKKSLELSRKAIPLAKGINNNYILSAIYLNMGACFDRLNLLDSALYYDNLALKLKIELKSIIGEAIVYNNLGEVYYKKKAFIKAKEHFQKSATIFKEGKNSEGYATALFGLSSVHIINGDDEAHQTILEAVDIANENKLIVVLRDGYKNVADAFAEKHNYEPAYKYYKKFYLLADSLLGDENQQNIDELHTKYDTEKNQLKIEGLEKEKTIQTIQLEKEETKRYMLYGGIFMLIIVVGISIRSYLRKKKDNVLISKQKNLVEQQKNVVELAHAELEEKNQEIMDSITYAKRIQNAILPPLKIIKEYLNDSFILYKPKDIVAGDFYWMEQKNNKTLFAAADCTGHGVPGAMVSVVCNNALNRSVREYHLSDPGEILNKTREIVIEEFEKSDEDVQDGMDIALCSLDGNSLQYAGAHNPLWIIRSSQKNKLVSTSTNTILNQTENSDYILYEIKADKQPIGKYDDLKPYTTHTFQLEKGDTIYIFSDGYVDQFGGEKGKKFKAKAFRNLLLANQEKSLKDQKIIIDNSFESWRGDLEQIDDVCIIGVKI